MNSPLLHVFRNTPFGRETLLLSAYSCQKLQLPLDIYLPKEKRFLFYFDADVVQIDLDSSYLRDKGSARQHAEELIESFSLQHRFISPCSQTATGLPDLQTNFSLMTCPRSMSDVTGRIGLGHIGPKVRRILQLAPFPVLLPSAAYKPWNKLTVLYGGSPLAAVSVRLAMQLQKRCHLPMQIISVGDRPSLEKALESQGLIEQVHSCDWRVFPGSSLNDHFFEIPHDALVVLGAYGHGPIKALLGSSMEMVQSQLPNPLLVVGPRYRSLSDYS